MRAVRAKFSVVDKKAVGGLIERLDADGDPLWLRAQLIGALSAVTDQRFVYETGRWREWWAAARLTRRE